MKKLRYEYKTILNFTGDITDHKYSLRIFPPTDTRQVTTDPNFTITPSIGSTWHSRDSFGNLLLCGRIIPPHNEFSFTVTGTTTILSAYRCAGPVPQMYRFPTELTYPGETIYSFYMSHRDMLRSCRSIMDQALYLSHALYQSMTYTKGITSVSTTAEEAFRQKQGVCQDYAHIYISLMRLAAIPCRYVSGLACIDGETHAWVEFYDGEYWCGIDPTNDCLINMQYIKLCHGRDYNDCPVQKGIYLGIADSTQLIYSKVEERI